MKEMSMKWVRCLTIGMGVLAILIFIISFVSFSQEGKKEQREKEGYLGAETCKDCHPEIYDLFKKDPHRGKECESCHGPGAKHAEAEGKGFIFSYQQGNTKDRSDICLKCHEKQKTFFQFRRGVHRLSSVGCDNCHQIHSTKVAKNLLKKKDPDLCFSCHGDVKSKFYLPNKHPVIQGALTCSDCHTPHGSQTRASLRKINKFNIDVCFKCHPEKRGPWVFEHGAQKFEGCNVCHSPHGSPNKFMLIRRNIRTLCMECHGQPHFPNFSCVNCHTQIHGSNFSSRFLQ
jgi:DmsE family decaheme c-type cytochrome